VQVFRFEPYQCRWIDDEARRAFVIKPRQVGYSFAEAYRAVEDCLRRRKRHYYLSVSEARAREVIEYATTFSQMMGLARCHLKVDDWGWKDVHYAKSRINYPNGSQFIALPANPRTARGASGDLTLDECAHYLQGEQIWTACHALVTRGHSLRLITTPNGMQGLAHRIWTRNGKMTPEEIAEALAAGQQPLDDGWSRHFITIEQAKAEAFPESPIAHLDLEELRELAGTEDNWLQEYCGVFLDESLAWIPYSMIEAATHDDALLHADLTYQPSGQVSLGADIGRKRDHTILWENEKRGNVHWPIGIERLIQQPFAVQRAAIWDRMPRVGRACIDETGIGLNLAEDAVEYWGELSVTGVPFTAQNSKRLATLVRKHLERKTAMLPDDADIRRELHSVRRVYTDDGHVSFQAPRTKTGHADSFWALGLALMAGEDAPDRLAKGDIVPAGQTPRVERTGAGWGGY
jgi:phage FluMu gp28-like protein